MTKNVGDHARKVHARELAADVVVALFRLVKLSTLHSLDNQAVVRQVDDTVRLVAEYGERTDHNVSILFAHGSVFVGGQLLRANRGVYEGALELGAILARVGAAEIGIRREAQANDFYALASGLADALRKPKPPVIDRPSPNIRLRGLAASAMLRESSMSERVDPTGEVARTYASAVVIMRRFFEELRRGKYDLPQRVKRVAQRLVDLSMGETPAFLGVTAARNQNFDDAGRAVNTAILGLAMTRQITSDSVQLSRVAMAALLYDAARARIAGVAGDGKAMLVIPQLTEQQENDSPAGTAVVLTALGRVNEPSVMRTVISYEAHWEKRRARLGPVYNGLRAPSLQARIVQIARAFNDALTPMPGQTPPSADEAIARLEQESADAADRTVLRLLIGALGIFTTGTIVKLSTGETGIVVQTPSHPSLYSQPRVRLVLDANGGWMQPPIEIDLAHAGEPQRHVREVVATADDPAGAQMRAIAAGPSATSGVRMQSSASLAPSSVHTPPSDPSRTSAPDHSYLGSSQGQRARTSSYPQAAEAREQQVEREAARPAVPPARPDDTGAATRAMTWEEHARVMAEAPSVHDEVTNAMPEDVMREHAAVDGSEAPSEPEPSNDQPKGPPTAEGTLQKTPFLHLLIYMLDQRLTGTTVFTLSNGVAHALYFHDGTPAKVRTGSMIEPLDRVLVDEGMLDEATLRGTLVEVSKTHVLHGRLLVMKGVLDREKVLHALRVQVLRKVTHLFELPADTRFAYYQDENLLASYGGPELTPTEPLAVIMAGIRHMAGNPLVDATLAKVGNRPIALHLDAEMKRFQLTREEQAVIDLIRTRKMPLAELVAANVAQARVVRLTVYALVVTRHLDLGIPGKAPVGLGRPPLASEPLRQAVSAAPRRLSEQSPVSSSPNPVSSSPISPQPMSPLPMSVPVSSLPVSSLPVSSKPMSSKPVSANPLSANPLSPRGQPRKPIDVVEATPGARPTVKLPRASPTTPSPAPDVPIATIAPGVPIAPTVAPPSAERPEMAARREEIRKRVQTIDAEDYYSMLGVTAESTTDQVRAAYFALAKNWHPDRLPAELLDVKQQVARVFARFSEAYQTLSDPVKAKDYAQLAKSGGGSPGDQEKVARVVDAAFQFQKAEILLKKNDVAGAEQLADSAVKADPDQPSYLALLVWIRAIRRGDPPELREGQTSTHFDDLIRLLDTILAREPEFERALYYRGVLLKRSGRMDRAIRDFRLASALNPKNIDAVREVRIYEMRKRDATKPSEPDSLLGKFFKR